MDLRRWFSPLQPLPSADSDTTATTTSTTVSESRAGPSTNASYGQTPAPTDVTSAAMIEQKSTSPPSQRTAVDDIGTDRPVQILLTQYPVTVYSGKGRSFVDKWFHNREWLEYSVKADAAFCFCCRMFSVTRKSGTLDAFASVGYRNWKHAMAKDRGFHKHETSKDHMSCYAMWKEREMRRNTGNEVSTLVNADQLRKNRYYVSSLIDVVGFLVENQLPLRGKIDAFDDMSEGGSGLFLSMLYYTIQKDPELANVVKTIPRNATYTCHDMQNELIRTLSNVVTEAIVEEVGDSYYTLKVDGTRDPTGCENISIVLRFVNETYEVTERLLCIATAQKGDAQTLTDTVLTELNKVGLDSSKILSQVYDGAALMSGKRGGVQKILQDRLGREIPYVHCLNHQLHLVVVHAMSAETALLEFFEVCDSIYKFCRKPTVAMHYKGAHLKRLLAQRWTGHLATVSVILKSFNDIKSILTNADTVLNYGAETRMEATGLLRETSEPSFMFLANLTHRVLSLLDPPNKLLQREDTDMLTGLSVVASATACVKKLRCDEEFKQMLDTATPTSDSLRPGPKRRRIESTRMDGYIVTGPTGGHRGDDDLETELRRLYYNTIDSVVGELERRFSERNSQLASALAALNPEADNFLDVKAVKHILDLSQSIMIDAEFEVAKEFLMSQKQAMQQDWTIQHIISTYHNHLIAMPSVLTAFKHALTFGASTAMCENSFSTLKNVFSEHRRTMLHERKARLVQLAFEKDLTRKCTREWKDTVLRRFSSNTRRLQLF
ncbi:hypothetical protein UPYG_G00264930 [Umbra pygmaea]|uniref:TTF-type domain-containing protein n=1 Tax=Umbra pygmaea TaxID=75934 RepID=A0ABD0W9Q3_UMBPY